VITYLLSFAAGTLTAISPCVLPALPLIAGSATQEHKLAPVAVAGGMMTSFTFVGALLASAGDLFGLDSDNVRMIAAALMIAFGIALAWAAFPSKQGGGTQHWQQKIFGPLAGAANRLLSHHRFGGIAGQFALGTLLGAVWSPCVGPTMGAAVGLASQSGGLPQATAMMFIYSAGAALPLLMIAYGARGLIARHRTRLLAFGQKSKPILGAICILVGMAILTGLDKRAEAGLVESLPQAWVDFTTRL